MATIHLAGTSLEPQAPKLPLIKPFLVSIAVVFLLAMHIFTPNPGGAGLALSFNTTTWMAVSFSLAIGLYQVGTQGVVRYNKLTIGLFLCCVLITIPVAFPHSDFSLSQGKLLGLWSGYGLFFVLQQFRFSNKQKQRLLWFITIAAFMQALFGWFQYLVLQPDNLFGYDTVHNRPYGIFQQPNVMASFLATGLALSGYLLTRHPKKYNRHLSEVSLLYLMPVVTVPLLVILASRTGWLGAFLSVVLLLSYLYRFATKKRFWGWLIAIIIGLAIGFSSITFADKKNIASQKVSLEDVRQFIYPQALDMLVERPFTGYGYGRFEPEYIVYTARQHQLNPNYHPGLASMDHPHNELLYWGVEGGLLPVLAIVLAAVMVLVRIYNVKKGTRLAMFALFVPIILHSQLEYPFYHSAIHWITFVVLLFWIDQRARSYRFASFSIVTKTLFRVMSLVLPIITSFYMLTALHTNYVLTQFETSQPKNPDLLKQVSNPIVWKDRYDWDIYSTYLNIGLYRQEAKFIQPYIDWSLKTIKDKPRPAFYNNLILAYQGLGDSERAEQIRREAQYLFPTRDFSQVQYIAPDIDALKADNEK
ncbi:PglL family O-oligosaccharyltransferase [Vibrio neptunius]|uniref:PglL family O-oligosaccharyltransferase n=1 Tax=Vibrio neptunius TaxID=170651 RepID=A0ABS3A3V8_9VIBR|nr:PglL family O-oligosaccharyltransferase [Vibrio neptunius]MBN3493494.1 PglL family O-oligosaccharyltransferase [Vibrio neptunius]MBN3516047.1 PglL family O-oligosaccharyltransferase [Vibrio neptunius]MBN3550262.1 PglL family O-oligosaccharyltransferase [Vibrio neptunius]MBN3578352.1 PglL family O-oligosaccharyltransferase [Vibrio neptunius]MCH9872016.1 PglL family O-oligosaccharyltransferase [Vibrio neptunius]